MPHTLAALCDKHDETPSEAETMEQSRDATKLNLNIVTVCALLVVIGGGAFSFATLFEQSRRNGETLEKFSTAMMSMQIEMATWKNTVQTLVEQVSELKRENKRT